MNAFEDYGRRATTTAAPRLVGVLKTRTEAKQRYIEIVAHLNALTALADFHPYIASLEPELVQFRTELDFFWNGDGDFVGLQREIERTEARLDERLDNPRHELN